MSDLLDLALDGHGGLARWRGLTSISATMTASGGLFTWKGHPGGLGTVQASADVARPRLTFTPFAGSARGQFAPDHLEVTAADGSVQQQLDNPRETLLRLDLNVPWNELHLLYFTGYAMWNYLCSPFLLSWPGIQSEEIEPLVEGGETWRRLRVVFPSNIPTHNDEQIFYFDESGHTRRLDYAPDVLGSQPAAHYCNDHKDFAGLIVPTRRRVYRRRADGTASDQAFIEIDISKVSLS